MTLAEIRAMPTTLEFCSRMIGEAGIRRSRVHESCVRSYQCLEKVKELLRKECPPAVILEIIADIQTAPGIDKEVQ